MKYSTLPMQKRRDFEKTEWKSMYSEYRSGNRSDPYWEQFRTYDQEPGMYYDPEKEEYKSFQRARIKRKYGI